jgi:hypothetical protein
MISRFSAIVISLLVIQEFLSVACWRKQTR